ncbi:hypothetical protein HYH02_001770 [Chlamydomonas schloesseri]|uniref:C3H1-type domain-containing protein n=1 Tax=Chlamydomonas schloesseri TaxID=2026947 RepID=A0A835WTV3_9CHLO|nr:hypothetical protein HYH02_001770 [Chlamydomonas schloesseri]|eukprot:KAG2453551.1 hypothetical protein HYH02_001770 [Chlamydomonas schloesseri]
METAPGQKQLCTFFLRTGTCAYGDRCKFSHPADRPPPQLNSRGYPVRAEEPDCAHYLKKGWCAFGPTCKYNHPEIVGGLSSYSLSQPPTAYVSLPTTTFPSATVYSVPSAVPTLYYLPPGMGPNQLAGSTVSLLPSNVGAMAAATQPSQLAFTQQSALGGGAPATMYRQPAAANPYGGMGGGMGGGMAGMGMGAMASGGMAMGGGMGGMGGGMGGMGGGGGMNATSVSALHEAFQGLALGRSAGGLGGRK